MKSPNLVILGIIGAVVYLFTRKKTTQGGNGDGKPERPSNMSALAYKYESQLLAGTYSGDFVEVWAYIHLNESDSWETLSSVEQDYLTRLYEYMMANSPGGY